jgi:hypothetical protein
LALHMAVVGARLQLAPPVAHVALVWPFNSRSRCPLHRQRKSWRN